MAVKTSCPHCDHEYTLTDNQVGKTVRCRACREAFTVEVAGSRSRDEEERPSRSERRRDRDDEDRDENRGRRRSRRRGIPVWVWLLGGAALLLVLCGGGGVILWMRGGPGGGWLGGARPLTRESFEEVKKDMPKSEVVRILGTPHRNENTFGLETMVWESGSTKIEVLCVGGMVNHMKGTFNDSSEATPAAWTPANFNKLKWNMSRSEVRALLGPPQEISGGMVFDLVPATAYTWRQGGNEISASFQGDKLYQATARLNGRALLLQQKPLGVPDSNLPTGPSKLTQANFRRIRPKMSQAQVRAIFGPPQHSFAGDTWMDARGNNVQALYRDDKVVLATAVINGKSLSMNAGP